MDLYDYASYDNVLNNRDSSNSFRTGSLNPPYPKEDVPIKLKSHTRRLLVDNRDRSSGTAFDFQVLFGNAYRANSSGVSEYINVSAVEMKLVAFPKVADEAYVILDIRELNDSNLDATNNAGTKSFVVAFFDTSTLADGDVKPIRDFYSQRVTFDPPLSKLDRLSVRCLKRDGTVVASGETGGKENVSMLLEVETMTS